MSWTRPFWWYKMPRPTDFHLDIWPTFKKDPPVAQTCLAKHSNSVFHISHIGIACENTYPIVPNSVAYWPWHLPFLVKTFDYSFRTNRHAVLIFKFILLSTETIIRSINQMIMISFSKYLTLCYNWAFILYTCFSCMKTLLVVQLFLTLWPWLFTIFVNNITCLKKCDTMNIQASYLTLVNILKRPFYRMY